uniref:Immunoglobulin V-set domain-containing protein n=1 Tax=Megaselia scalaris TaxID=36166 RepID=T1GK53_MEGSC
MTQSNFISQIEKLKGCENLDSWKFAVEAYYQMEGLWKAVAWLRVDTQTILTIQNHVITKNQRVGITYAEHKTWQLKIKDIKESDRGWYMCQINTDPMKSQMGYLDVV